jgi:MFS family permease
MSIDIRRVAVVAVALAGVGAVVGGVLGAALVGAITIKHGLWRDALGPGAAFGALVGAVLAPIAAFTLMRRVPIWRAIAETAVGTVAGAALGMLLQPTFTGFFASEIFLGVVGFAVAAVRLRVTQKKLPVSRQPDLLE